jgi:hypothetical protein
MDGIVSASYLSLQVQIDSSLIYSFTYRAHVKSTGTYTYWSMNSRKATKLQHSVIGS